MISSLTGWNLDLLLVCHWSVGEDVRFWETTFEMMLLVWTDYVFRVLYLMMPTYSGGLELNLIFQIKNTRLDAVLARSVRACACRKKLIDTLKNQFHSKRLLSIPTKVGLWATDRRKSWMQFLMNEWSKVTHQNWVSERIRHVRPLQLKAFLFFSTLSLSKSFLKYNVLCWNDQQRH